VARAARRPRLRALVLAAGRGERLRPYTLSTPKPLLPVRGRPLIAWSLDSLARHRQELGIDEVAINLHHLGPQIRAAIGDRHDGLRIRYSDESAQLLGTLGALHPLREFLAAAPRFLILNGDSWCDWPLDRLLAAHLAARDGRTATLLLTSRADPGEYGGGVGVDRRGNVVTFGRERDERISARRVFAGAHVLERRLLERVPPGPGDTIGGLYEPLLAEGATLGTWTTNRRWHDLGTPARCRAAGVDLTRR
jgi:MurNAc alpha-1-phosphate uridylyltransferase